MTNERKEAIRAYKERTTPRGIFSIRCVATGDVWVGVAPNLDSARNSNWFTLRYGRHRNARLQAAWDTHGEQSFGFATVEELDKDTPALLVRDVLKKRKDAWVMRLGASAL